MDRLFFVFGQFVQVGVYSRVRHRHGPGVRVTDTANQVRVMA